MADKTLFKGTAPLYARYRPQYPDKVFRLIKKYFPQSRELRALDLGCGPGTLSLILSKFCREIVAVDIDQGMVEEGKKQARERGVKNIKWIVSPAERIKPALGQFDLIVFSNSFHWMNQDKVLKLALKLLQSQGTLVLVSGHSWWNSKVKWHKSVIAVLKRHLGQRRRAGQGLYKSRNDEKENEDKFENSLPRSGFRIMWAGEVPLKYKMSIDEVINFLYTSSFAAQHLFKGQHKKFEQDLRSELKKISPRRQFEEKTSFSLFVCKPK